MFHKRISLDMYIEKTYKLSQDLFNIDHKIGKSCSNLTNWYMLVGLVNTSKWLEGL